jgi:hypothetical protein
MMIDETNQPGAYMSDNNQHAFSDDTIAAIVKILQFGLLAGLDVTDYFRSMRLQINEAGFVEPTAEWLARFEEEIVDTNNVIIEKASTTATETKPAVELN